MKPANLTDFVTESWAIEGIPLDAAETERMVAIHADFLSRGYVNADDVVRLALRICPHAYLRYGYGMNVTVGTHMSPPGGPGIFNELAGLLSEAHEITPYELHERFECLHPFMDGNGRTGRLLWLWRRGGKMLAPSFLQQWYYDSLAQAQRV